MPGMVHMSMELSAILTFVFWFFAPIGVLIGIKGVISDFTMLRAESRKAKKGHHRR